MISFFKFLWDDLKSDFNTIAEIGRRIQAKEPVINPEKKKQWQEEMRQITLYSFMRDNWLFFLLLALAFISGWFVASQYYQSECNKLITETILPQCVPFTGPNISDLYISLP